MALRYLKRTCEGEQRSRLGHVLVQIRLDKGM